MLVEKKLHDSTWVTLKGPITFRFFLNCSSQTPRDCLLQLLENVELLTFHFKYGNLSFRLTKICQKRTKNMLEKKSLFRGDGKIRFFLYTKLHGDFYLKPFFINFLTQLCQVKIGREQNIPKYEFIYIYRVGEKCNFLFLIKEIPITLDTQKLESKFEMLRKEKHTFVILQESQSWGSSLSDRKLELI